MIIQPRPDQRWDGSQKLFAKDCPNCNYYILIEEHDLCGGGRSYKYLTKVEKPIKCGITKSENPSINYLREVAKNPDKYRISTHDQLKLEVN